MLKIHLRGGLGNQLFQVAAGLSLSREHNRDLVLSECPVTHHSTVNYFDSILSKYSDYQTECVPEKTIHERSYRLNDWESFEGINRPELVGYFQNWRYIPLDFKDSLVLPEVPEMNGAFLHIRGGDYIGHYFHDVGLHQYYSNAIQLFPKDTHFFVFTNDRSYAEKQPYLQDISYSFVDADEERCLAMMMKCQGGICANSSFSWWGAYLNPIRPLVLPSKWFTDQSVWAAGYYFPGCIIGQV